MDKSLKQRMIGAVVLIALAVIFIPMLLNGGSEGDPETVTREIPLPPEGEFQSRLMPLDGVQTPGLGDGVGESTTATSVNGSPSDASPAGELSRIPVASTDNRSSESNRQPDADLGIEAVEPTVAEPQQTGAEPQREATSDAQPVPVDPLGNWFVQVGSFAEQANASELRDRLRATGFTAFIEQDTVDGNARHRVMVGPHMDEAGADEVRDEIQARFGLNGIVEEQP